MTVLKFSCACGNRDPGKVIEHDGALGYEAIVCKVCGRYSDHVGKHEADEWSLPLVGRTPVSSSNG